MNSPGDQTDPSLAKMELPFFGPTLGGPPDRSPLFTRLRFAAELLAEAGTLPEHAFLGFRQKDRSVRVIEIGVGLVVGRQTGCELVIADDPKLGRRQFQIAASDSLYFLEDLGSRNGTYVNDSNERVQRRELRDGDLIFAGNQIFLFVNPASTPSGAPA